MKYLLDIYTQVGYHHISIRINDQYRICFTVDGNEFFNVEIVDYH